jgi:hypothetical protein
MGTSSLGTLRIAFAITMVPLIWNPQDGNPHDAGARGSRRQAHFGGPGESRDGIVLRLGLFAERTSDASSPLAPWTGHLSAHPCRSIAATGVARAQTSFTDPRERSPVS